ncbi:FtsH protease activity modulator HflK [Futiania mangrovi]|uniref:Protein HflK n=1 Tax=Futiania mangrovi TaxID=2959716 RepID=A0A9J6PBN5_9PROT|nr:FtsH protease activity modulator HflK [Futiania mangrovii]MCP1334979.1 FtsH protease activity modulator HflK [Futiania mangrovii]
MPWNQGNGGPWGGGGDNGHGGGGGQGPWGQGPRGGGGPGGGGPQPPNLDDLIRQGQEKLKRALPGGMGGGGGKKSWPIIALVAIAGLVALDFIGQANIFFYRVQADEQGVVLRFGEYNRTSAPGLHMKLPTPVETVLTPTVTRVNRIDVGYVSGAEQGRSDLVRDMPQESLMLTGDANIVDIDFAIFWRIKDAGQYLFNVADQAGTVKAVAESVMREVIGRSEIEPILTEARQEVEQAVREGAQRTLDDYGAGIEVAQIQLLKVDPPAQVIDAFRDVEAARQDQQRLRNEAEAYANRVIPEARGQSEQIRQGAEGYREQVVADAQGEAQRFLDILEEYRKAQDITTERLFLETMEDVLAGKQKVIIDQAPGEGQGVLPYLPLPELQRRTPRAGTSN